MKRSLPYVACLAFAFLLFSARPAHTVVVGDCLHDGDTSISELQICINIFLGDPLILCPPCSLDGEEVGIVDLQSAINCFLDATDPTCPMAAGGGDASPTPTSTPTDTPMAAADTPTPTSTVPPLPTQTPTQTATRTPTPVCGDGLLQKGEECDACMPGEQCSCAPAECSVCAADCTIGPCTETTTVQVFRVDYSPPIGQPVTSIKVRVGYRDTKIAITGNGSAAGTSIKNRPSNTTTIVNDLNYGLEVTMQRANGLNEGRLFTVDFKTCMGAVPATLADFSCSVLDCASSFGSTQGCTCTVTTP